MGKKPFNYFFNTYKSHNKENGDEKKEHPEPFEKIERQERKHPPKQDISKKRLSALYMIFAGKDKASLILKKLGEDERQAVIGEILHITRVSEDDHKLVEQFFGSLPVSDIDSIRGGKEYVRTLLHHTFGISEGSHIFIKTIETDEEGEFGFLEKRPPQRIKEVLEKEGDAIIALVLNFLSPKKTADVISLLPPERATAIVRILAEKKEIRPEIIATVDTKLRKKLEEIEDEGSIRIGGKNRLTEILKHIDPEEASAILSEIEEETPGLAEEIKEGLFTFSDIARIPRKELEKALIDYADIEIAALLKGTDSEIREVFLSSVTRRRRKTIEDEMNYMGPLKKNEVREKQKAFIDHLKELELEGKIILHPDSDIYVE